jgi:general secretion pathway protein L
MTFSIRNFFRWWFTGLLYLFPASIRKIITFVPDRITLEFNGKEVTLRHFRSGSPETNRADTFLFEDEAEKTRIRRWLNGHHDQETITILLVPENKVLVRPLTLPSATGDDIRQVLGFEMDRKTPFTAEDVYFDHAITGHDQDARRIHVDLLIAMKNQIDEIVDTVRSWDIGPDIITTKKLLHGPNDINLLPPEERRGQNGQADHLTPVIAIIAFLLFIAAFYSPLIQQTKILEELENKVTKDHDTVVAVQALKKEKETILEESFFLTEKKGARIATIDVIDELTKIMPDDTWINRFNIRNNELQIYGESTAASSLIEVMESSGYFSDTHFRSPVTQNNVTKKDKFHISATLVEEGSS